jgi:hypothetical protein
MTLCWVAVSAWSSIAAQPSRSELV